MLVVRFDEPGCIDAISQLAQRFHARLLITTLPTLREPEARNVLGLIAAPVASSTLLRNTG
jgi:hypothetical protein